VNELCVPRPRNFTVGFEISNTVSYQAPRILGVRLPGNGPLLPQIPEIQLAVQMYLLGGVIAREYRREEWEWDSSIRRLTSLA
jgi:hypothetical protein